MNRDLIISVDANLFPTAEDFKAHMYGVFEKAKPSIFDIVGQSFEMNFDDLKPVVKPVAVKKDSNVPKMTWTYQMTFDNPVPFKAQLDLGMKSNFEVSIDESFKPSGGLTLFSTHDGVSVDFQSIKIYFSADSPFRIIKIKYKKSITDDVVSHEEAFDGTVLEAVNRAKEFFASVDYSF